MPHQPPLIKSYNFRVNVTTGLVCVCSELEELCRPWPGINTMNDWLFYAKVSLSD